eukprot:SAG22_NODE_17_length_32684_cov_34.234095_3_plen_4499_part_00
MPKIAVIHTGDQDDFVVDIPAVSLSVLKDLLIRRLELGSHDIEQIRPAIVGADAAAADAEEGSPRTDLAPAAGSAVAAVSGGGGASLANAWDGSPRYIRGGKFDPKLAGRSATAVLEYGAAVRQEDQWQSLVRSATAMQHAMREEPCISLHVQLVDFPEPHAPVNEHGQPAFSKAELHAALHKQALGDAPPEDRAEIIRKLRQMEGLGEASTAWVSRKALSFCCASTVFLSKAAPFIVVPLDQVSNAQKAKDAVLAAETKRQEQLKEVQGGKAYMEEYNLKKFQEATDAQEQARFRAKAFALYENEEISTEAQEAKKQKAAAEAKVAAAKAEAEAAEAAAKIDDEDDVDQEEFEFYQKRKTRRLICYLKTFFLLCILGVAVVALVIFHMWVYECSFVVGTDAGVKNTTRGNFSALNTKLIEVRSNRGNVVVEVDDGDDIRVEATHYARDFQTMQKVATQMEQGYRGIFIVSDWKIEYDGVFGGCPHSDIHIWIPRSMKEGTAFLRQVWNSDLNFGLGAYEDPVPIAVENIADIDIRINSSDTRSWMLPRRGSIDVALGDGIAFGNVTLESYNGRVALSGMKGSYATLTSHGADVDVSFVEAEVVQVHTVAASYSEQNFWPLAILHSWPVLQRHVGTVTVSNATFCESPCSQWSPPRNLTANEIAMATRSYAWMDAETSWSVEAYHEYRGHEAHRVVQRFWRNDATFWYARLSPDDMWLDFDLAEAYTIYGIALTGHVRGGIPDRCDFQSQKAVGGVERWQTVTQFQPENTLDLQEFLGFEGTGRVWRLNIRGTYPAMQESLSVAFARNRDAEEGITAQAGWHEIDQWKCVDMPSLAQNGRFDTTVGRYTTTRPTIACAAAQVSVTATGRLAVRIVVNSGLSVETGISTFSANTNREQTLHARGMLMMHAGDFISVWLHADDSASYTVHPQSGFSCALMGTDLGFGADLATTQPKTTVGWTELGGWSTSGAGGLGGLFDEGAGFDTASGRFYAASNGVFVASAQVRLDGADSGYFRVMIALNGAPDANNGLYVVDRSPPPDYADFSVNGVLALQKDDYLSVWVYADEDNMYGVSGQSGFSCARIDTSNGFGARLPAARSVMAAGWSELSGWSTPGYGGGRGNSFVLGQTFNVADELVAGFDATTGRFTQGGAGAVHFFSAQVNVVPPDRGRVTLSLPVNGNVEGAIGMHSAFDQPRGLSVDLSVSGVIRLSASDYVSVWLYDTGYEAGIHVGVDSFFFGAQIADQNSFLANHYPASSWTEITDWQYERVPDSGGLSSELPLIIPNIATGRLTIERTSVYLCMATLLLAGEFVGELEVAVVINGRVDASSLRARTEAAHDKNTGFAVNGLLRLEEGDFVSVWARVHEDISYTISSSSTFSCVKLQTSVAFSASLAETQTVAANAWAELTAWDVSDDGGHLGLFVFGTGFDGMAGRFTVSSQDVYSIGTNLLVSGCEASDVKATITANGDLQRSNLAYARTDCDSRDASPLALAATSMLDVGDYVSIWIEAPVVVNRSSGLTVSIMDTELGFGAALEMTQTTRAGAWSEVAGWNTNGTGLFELGRIFDTTTGRFHPFIQAPTLFFATAQVSVGSPLTQYTASIALNAMTDSRDNMKILMGSSNNRGLSLVGTVLVEANDYLSLLINSVDVTTVLPTTTFSCIRISSRQGVAGRMVSATGWAELQDWKWGGTELMASMMFDPMTGRFTARGGIYLAAAQLHLHEPDGLFRFMIALNGVPDPENGLHIMDGSPSPVYAGFGVGGVLRMQAGDYISVWVYADEDVNFRLSSQSSFSCVLLETDWAFGAALAVTQPQSAAGWAELGGWEVSGSGGRGGLFAVGAGFDSISGRFTAGSNGMYLASTQVRLDGADEGYFRVMIALNGANDLSSGLNTADGSPSPTFAGLSLTGVLAMESGDFISVLVYADVDSDYTVNSQSGFSCALLATSAGFSAMTADQLMISSSRWTPIQDWDISSARQLFALGSMYSSGGVFVSDRSSPFYCSININLGSGGGLVGQTSGQFSVGLFIQDATEAHSEVSVFASHSDLNHNSFSVGGIVYMAAGSRSSVWIRGHTDSQFRVIRYSTVTCAALDVSPDSGEIFTAIRQHEKWTEVTEWTTSGISAVPALFSSGNAPDAHGRYTAVVAGMHVSFANVRLEAANLGYFRIIVALNGVPDPENGLHIMDGSPSPVYAGFGVGGVLRMQAGDYISVWVYADEDVNFRLSSQSSFSCAHLDSNVGFGADLADTQSVLSLGWAELGGWEVSGSGGRGGLFAVGAGFDSISGRFTAPVTGVYLAAAQLRLDSADEGYFRMMIAVGGSTDLDNGLHVTDSAPSPDYAGFSVSGVLALQGGDFASVFVYSDEDFNYRISSQSGFSCALLETSSAFGSDLATRRYVSTEGWTEVGGWETSGSGGRGNLFQLGRSFERQLGQLQIADGVVITSGMYFCALHAALRDAGTGYFKIAVAVNGHSSLSTIHEERDSGGSMLLTVSGLITVRPGDIVSAWVFSEADDRFELQTESGFSCARLESLEAIGSTLTAATRVREIEKWTLNWKTDSQLLQHNSFQDGRFRVRETGVYLVSLHIKFHAVVNGPLGVGVALNAMPDPDNGLHAMDGRPMAETSFSVSGILKMNAGDSLSAYVYAGGHVSYTLDGQSGFSVALMSTDIAFGSDLVDARLVSALGWTELGQWETTGSGGRVGLFAQGAGFDPISGRFTAPNTGIYMASVQLRLDGADSGFFRGMIAMNGAPELENALHVTAANPAPDYAGLSFDGVLALQQDDFLSVWVYADTDASYTVSGQSGFSCGQMETSIAFGSQLPASESVAATGWTELRQWDTSDSAGQGNFTMFERGDGLSAVTGRFTSEVDAVYFFSAQVTVRSPSRGRFVLSLPVNGNVETATGVQSEFDESRGSTVDLSVSGVIRLGVSDYVSVFVHVPVDPVLGLNSQVKPRLDVASFSGALLVSDTGVSVAHAQSSWTELNWAEEMTMEHQLTQFNYGTPVDYGSGRFTPMTAGVYIVHAVVRLSRAVMGWHRLVVGLNGLPDPENGLHLMDGKPMPEESALTVAGVLKLQAGDFISVWVHAFEDISYVVSSDSGLSCALMGTDYGFGADLVATQPQERTGWAEIGGWSTSGSGGRGGLFDLGAGVDADVGIGFDAASGRFSAGSAGFYVASTTLRLDGADMGSFSVSIALNGETTSADGLHITDSSPSPDYAGFSLSGFFALEEGDFVSVWVHADDDSMYNVNGQSGFSCAQLETAIGFGSRLAHQVSASGPSGVGGWDTGSASSVGRGNRFYQGAGLDAAAGSYEAPTEGVYLMSLLLELDAGNTTQLAVSLVKDAEVVDTFPVLQSAELSEFRYEKMIYLRRDATIQTVIIPDANFSSYSISNRSSFSCVLISTSASGPALARVDLLGYRGASTYDAGHGGVNVVSDDGNISLTNLSAMSVDIYTRRESQSPICPIPDMPDGIPKPAIGVVSMEFHVQEVQGRYNLVAPVNEATVEVDQMDIVLLDGTPVQGSRDGHWGATASQVRGEIGESSLTRQDINVNSASGNVLLYIRTDGYTVCPDDCNGQGRCLADGTCSCWAGFDGYDCSIMTCPNSCSARGECDGGTGLCACDEKFMGRDCAKISCTRPLALGGTVTEACGVCAADASGMCKYTRSALPITSHVSIILLLNRIEGDIHSGVEVDVNVTQNVSRSRRYTNITEPVEIEAPITAEGIVSDIAQALDLPINLFSTVSFANVSLPSTMWTPPVCYVTLHENGDFTGWQAKFEPAQYSLSLLEAGGVVDDDVESIFISEGCQAVVYQHSWGGWQATLQAGAYSSSALVAAGATLNDLSAMIVTQISFEPAPVTRQMTIELVAELPESRKFSLLLAGGSRRRLAQSHPDFDLIREPAYESGSLFRPARTYYALQSHRRSAELVSEGTDPTINPSPVQYGGQSVYLIEVLIDCPRDCSSRALAEDCDKVTGTCTCRPGFYRDDCGLVTCPNDCTGRGLCDPIAGECACFTGYIGDGCEQINCTTSCNSVPTALMLARGAPTTGYGTCDYETGRCACIPGVSYGDNCDLYFCPMNCSKAGICDATTGDCRCNPGRVLADCSGRSCPAVDPPVTAVVSYAVNASDREACFIPWDDEEVLVMQFGYTCETAAAGGLCSVDLFQEKCGCSCKPSSDPRPCYLGNILEYYDDEIAITASGTPCADWDGRMSLSPRHRNYCRQRGGAFDVPWCYTSPRVPPVQIQLASTSRLRAGDEENNGGPLCLQRAGEHATASSGIRVALSPCRNITDLKTELNFSDWGAGGAAASPDWDRFSEQLDLWSYNSTMHPAIASKDTAWLEQQDDDVLLLLNELGFFTPGERPQHVNRSLPPVGTLDQGLRRTSSDGGGGMSMAVETVVPIAAKGQPLLEVWRFRFADRHTTTAWGQFGCSGRGLCDVTVGACMCFDGYAGSDCAVQLRAEAIAAAAAAVAAVAAASAAAAAAENAAAAAAAAAALAANASNGGAGGSGSGSHSWAG